jgi:hypothetical protein
MTKDKPPEGPKTIEIIKGSKEHLEYIFKLLASNLNDNDYSHVDGSNANDFCRP